jgi:repressor LexA
MDMTNRDNQLLEFIRDFTDANGYAPTFEEMMEGIGLGNKRSITLALGRLEQADRIRRSPGKSRSVRVLDATPMID